MYNFVIGLFVCSLFGIFFSYTMILSSVSNDRVKWIASKKEMKGWDLLRVMLYVCFYPISFVLFYIPRNCGIWMDKRFGL